MERLVLGLPRRTGRRGRRGGSAARLLGRSELQVGQNAADDVGLGDDRDHLHRGPASTANQWIDLIHPLDQATPVAADFDGRAVAIRRRTLRQRLAVGDGRGVRGPRRSLLRLAQTAGSIAVESIPDGGLLMRIGNVRDDLGDEGQAVEDAKVRLVAGVDLVPLVDDLLSLREDATDHDRGMHQVTRHSFPPRSISGGDLVPDEPPEPRVLPREELRDDALVDRPLVQEHPEHPVTEQLLELLCFGDLRHRRERPVLSEAPPRDEHVDVRMKVEELSVRLDAHHRAGNGTPLSYGRRQELLHRLVARLRQLREAPTVPTEGPPDHLRHREDDVAMRDLREDLLDGELPELHLPFLVA